MKYSEEDIREYIYNYTMHPHCNGKIIEMFQQLLDERKWIPVNERLPETMKEVLVFTKYGQYKVMYEKLNAQPGYFQQWDGTAIDNREIDSDNVTHWMPIPETPK